MWEGLFNEMGSNFANTIDGYLEECMLRFLKNLGLIPAGATVDQMHNDYRAVREAYGYRWLRPDDQILAGTALTYSYLHPSAGAAANIFAAATARVPQQQAIVHIGWYSDINMGEAGMLIINVNAIKKTEIPQLIVQRQTIPMHAYFPLNSTLFLKQGDQVQWQFRQTTGVGLTGITFPIAAIFGTLSQLGMV